jgi:hypothetical protein
MKKIFAVLALMLAACLQGHAQLASLGSEKGSTNWETLTSSNYKVVYPVGMDSLGRVYSGYLEQFRPLVGNSAGFFPNQQYRKPMPVVLHPFAATANGAVVWGPRRMDIYTYPDAYSSLPPVPWEKILAIHENRHVAQMQFGRAGFWKYLYWPFGELIPLFVGSIYSNHAFLEGDAVVAETALTQSGRGRTADFLSYIRMSFATGDMRNWYRWLYGSQRRYTPDYYKIGYMTVAGMRYNYDATMFMSDYLWNLTSPFAFNSVQKTMKKYSGKRIKGTWEEIAATFKDIWEQDDAARSPFQEVNFLVPPTDKYYTSYRGAVQAGDGRVYALRTALDRPQELVELLPDGKVSAVRPMGADSKLVYSPHTGCLYWAETVPDLRWDMVQTSRIRFVKAGGNKIQDLTSGGKYVSPAVSDDGTALAVAEYPDKGGSRIVLLDIENGREIKSVPAPAGLQVTEVAFMGDRVAFTGISDKGMGLYLTDFSAIQTLEEPVPVKIKNMISRSGVLYFTCDRTGTNEIYSYSPGVLTQLTNTWHGVSFPFFRDDILCFMALSPAGQIPATVEAPLSRKASLSDHAAYPVADFLSSQEKDFPQRQAEAAAPVKAGYSKPANFLHIHSWLPFYFNIGEYTSQTEYTYQTGTLGATALFQNLTGTMFGSMGLSLHPDPFDDEKFAAGFHTHVTYAGLYPVLEFGLDVGDRRRAAISRGFVPAKDSTFLTVKPQPGTFVGGYVGASVPLNFSSGGRETTVTPGLKLKFSNDFLGEGFTFFDTDGVTEIPAADLSAEAPRELRMNTSFVASVSADTRLKKASSQVIPRFGAGGEIRAIVAPFQKGIGSGAYIGAYAYLPGLTSVQGLKLSAAAQSRTQESRYFRPAGSSAGYLMPMDVWAMGFEDMAPRGFEKTGVGTSMLLLSPESARISMDYVIPTLFMDRAFGPYIYLSNLEVNPFADFSIFVPGSTEYLYSAGADIIFRFEKLFMISNTIKLGARVAYNGGSGELYKSIGLKSPVYVGFVANTEL